MRMAAQAILTASTILYFAVVVSLELAQAIGYSRFESARLGCFVARQFAAGNCNTPG